MRIDVEQARKRAKERVKAGRAGKLADAQREVARELGYPSWPAMIHALEPPTVERVIREAGERPDRARELLEAAPGLRDDAWVALTLGNASRIDDAGRPGGPLALPPLFYVARSRIAHDNLPAARDLLARGFDPNLDDDARDVLIELAMRDVETLSSVVDSVGPNFRAQWGGRPRGTLLHQAAWFGRPDYVELLLRRGAEPDARVETDYATPLGWAAVGSRYSPNHPNDSFSAPDADHVTVAKLLVAAGAELEPKFADMALPPLSDWLGTL